MDEDFQDITLKDTTEKKSIFKLIVNICFTLFILFLIFSIVLSITNFNSIKDDDKGYLIHNITNTSEKDYTITTYHYLCYKIVKVKNNASTATYFRFWFMDDIDY